jgi:hypothetical protein
MDQAAADIAIKACLREIRDRAAQVGAASDIALLCADKGNIAQAIEICLGIEQPLYEASRLLDATSLLNRLSRTE